MLFFFEQKIGAVEIHVVFQLVRTPSGQCLRPLPPPSEVRSSRRADAGRGPVSKVSMLSRNSPVSGIIFVDHTGWVNGCSWRRFDSENCFLFEPCYHWLLSSEASWTSSTVRYWSESWTSSTILKVLTRFKTDAVLCCAAAPGGGGIAAFPVKAPAFAPVCPLSKT